MYEERRYNKPQIRTGKNHRIKDCKEYFWIQIKQRPWLQQRLHPIDQFRQNLSVHNCTLWDLRLLSDHAERIFWRRVRPWFWTGPQFDAGNSWTPCWRAIFSVSLFIGEKEKENTKNQKTIIYSLKCKKKDDRGHPFSDIHYTFQNSLELPGLRCFLDRDGNARIYATYSHFCYLHVAYPANFRTCERFSRLFYASAPSYT